MVKHFAGLYHFELPENWGKQKAKSKGGRPTIITDKVLRELELAFAYDCTVEEACILAGITPFTYYEFLKKQPKFSHTVALLRNVPILIARQTIVNGVHSSQDSARYYLERKVKSEFSPKLQLAHEGEIKHNHAISEETEQAIENIFTLFEKTALEVDDDTVDEK